MREALNLFSVKGYDAVSLRDIAAAVGIKESSLYNHFQNKQDIFDSIVAWCLARENEFFHAAHLIGDDRVFFADEAGAALYGNMTEDQFVETSGQVFEAVFADEIAVKLRRMLTIEQYRGEKQAELFRAVSFENSLAFQTQLFQSMIGAGSFKAGDPAMMALEFYAPIFLIFYRFDGDAEGVARAKELFMRHVRHFSQTYAAPRRG
jgi:AcrR family transcriptional regulator